jgi:hypothetical protein
MCLLKFYKNFTHFSTSFFFLIKPSKISFQPQFSNIKFSSLESQEIFFFHHDFSHFHFDLILFFSRLYFSIDFFSENYLIAHDFPSHFRASSGVKKAVVFSETVRTKLRNKTRSIFLLNREFLSFFSSIFFSFLLHKNKSVVSNGPRASEDCECEES